MKLKSFLLLLTTILSFSSMGYFDKADFLDEVRGKYILQTEYIGEIVFLVRSSGQVQVIDSDADEFLPVQTQISIGDNGMLRGLPVLQISFNSGSDEQAVDSYVLLTAEHNWDATKKTTLLASFTVENDGPNNVASVLSKKLKLLKYNSSLKKYVVLR
ncbi:hypothetical protein [Halobacteriovorax sp. HLS]|uniref:hypothetical protein n=1 Tax=Halobacteriovorax sp. HLS TaxID=2234000 RepID=UPI000FD93C7D|nr:hypothetical protein [Halobacteriovorax sp. HLS]